MAASTAARDSQFKDGILQNVPVGVAKINKGTLVSVQIADGSAYPARSGTATDIFMGEALETVDNSAGAAGAKSILVRRKGSIVVICSGFAQTDLGAIVYAADDQTVTKTSTNNQKVGKVTEFISATSVRIDMGGGANL
jgi:ribosomal protein L36